MPKPNKKIIGKPVSPKKLIEEVNSRSVQEIKNTRRKVDFLAKTKKEPSVESVIKIYRENRGKAEIELATLTSINEVLKNRQKEWPDLYNRWRIFFTLETIHKKK
jgi:hypothetical protein